jgi:hypothetical protein
MPHKHDQPVDRYQDFGKFLKGGGLLDNRDFADDNQGRYHCRRGVVVGIVKGR